MIALFVVTFGCTHCVQPVHLIIFAHRAGHRYNFSSLGTCAKVKNFLPNKTCFLILLRIVFHFFLITNSLFHAYFCISSIKTNQMWQKVHFYYRSVTTCGWSHLENFLPFWNFSRTYVLNFSYSRTFLCPAIEFNSKLSFTKVINCSLWFILNWAQAVALSYSDLVSGFRCAENHTPHDNFRCVMAECTRTSVRFTRKKLLAFVQVTKKILSAQSGSNLHLIFAPFVPETNHLFLQIKSNWHHCLKKYLHYLLTFDLGVCFCDPNCII